MHIIPGPAAGLHEGNDRSRFRMISSGIIIMLYYRLAEHINKYMSVVQYIVSTLSTRVGIQLLYVYIHGNNRVTKLYVISGHASPVFHADFFPRLVKYDVTSQPVNA